MKKLLFSIALVGIACSVIIPNKIILYAQSLPATKHVVWNASAPQFNVTEYIIVLDETQILVPASTACASTPCSFSLVLNAFGNHVVSVAARNLALSTDPASTQDSDPIVVNFSLNKKSDTLTGVGVTN